MKVLSPVNPSLGAAPCLSVSEWLIVGMMLLVVQGLLPQVGQPRSQPAASYRLPYARSADYWLAQQMVRSVPQDASILCLGDSVVWGEYVQPDDTWSAGLKRRVPDSNFINLGINGLHPLAMDGLITHKLRGVTNRRVIVHCNMLWLSSPERDLSSADAPGFNHPTLIPQFDPQIASYRASWEDRVAIATRRCFPLCDWTRHLQIACFDGSDLPHWTIENTRLSLFERLRRVAADQFSSTSDTGRHAARSWVEQRIGLQEFPWVQLSSSLQWRACQRLLSTLAARGNRVLVVLGPLNEHMMTPRSRERFQTIKETILSDFRARGIRHAAPELLPSQEYADASHPLAAGYARLAQWLSEAGEFRDFLAAPVAGT